MKATERKKDRKKRRKKVVVETNNVRYRYIQCTYRVCI